MRESSNLSMEILKTLNESQAFNAATLKASSHFLVTCCLHGLTQVERWHTVQPGLMCSDVEWSDMRDKIYFPNIGPYNPIHN